MAAVLAATKLVLLCCGSVTPARIFRVLAGMLRLAFTDVTGLLHTVVCDCVLRVVQQGQGCNLKIPGLKKVEKRHIML